MSGSQGLSYGPARPVGPAGGDLAGTGSDSSYPAPTLTAIGSAATKGSTSKSVTTQIDTKGRVVALSDQNIQIAESQVTGLSSDLSTLQATAPTSNQKAAMTAANSPSNANPFATIADLSPAAVPTGTRQGQIVVWNGSAYAVVQHPNYIDLPPVSPSSIDDEFNYTNASSPIGGKWIADANVSVGTANYANSLFSGVPGGTAVVDFDSEPGFMLIQAGGSSPSAGIGVHQDVSTYYAANNIVTATCEVNVGGSGTNYTANDGEVRWYITDSTFTTWVGIFLQDMNSTLTARFQSSANSNIGSLPLTPNSSGTFVSGPVYLGLLRQFNPGTSQQTWMAFIRLGQSRWNILMASSPTPPTVNFTPANMYFRGRNVNAPNAVAGIGWVRAANSIVLPTGG